MRIVLVSVSFNVKELARLSVLNFLVLSAL